MACRADSFSPGTVNQMVGETMRCLTVLAVLVLTSNAVLRYGISWIKNNLIAMFAAGMRRNRNDVPTAGRG